MKNALEIIQFLSYSSNAEVSKVSTWGAVKPESLNGLNRALRVIWNTRKWNFRREVLKKYVNQSKRTIPLSKNILGQNTIKINNKPLSYDKDIPFYEATTGTPTKYYIDKKDRIIVYPIPDDQYDVAIETYTTLPVIDSNYVSKGSFTAETDTLNIPERIEDLFIDCLSYFCNEILNGDPTDEEYQEHAIRQSEVFKLLVEADLVTEDNDESKGFLMPWQL
jgi:hypothetical protein